VEYFCDILSLSRSNAGVKVKYLKKWIIVFAALAVGIGLYFSMHVHGQAVSLEPIGNGSVELGTEKVRCKLINPTFYIVEYGDTFYLEHYVCECWKPVNDGGSDINFTLGVKTLGPLMKSELIFPISIYSKMEEQGEYRIIFPVKIGENTTSLFCQFSVK